jgi:phage/plasmid-like protein (TIGR03299 family)
MSHELKKVNGRIEMAYIGDEPWHGLGQRLTEGAGIDEWKRQAGMEWTVERAEVRFATATDALKTFKGRDVFYRSDTHAPLAVVSKQFKPVQPAEILEFFRDLTEIAGFKMNTAGVLKGGVKVWAMADIGEPMAIVGNDLVMPRMLVATACDGSMRTLVKNVTERVVCANTLAIAVGETDARQLQVSHRSEWNVHDIKAQLGLLPSAYALFMKRARELAHAEISPAVAESMTAALLGEDPAKEEKSTGYRSIMSLFDGGQIGADMPGVKGTPWGWLNAVTEYYDYTVRARNDDNRLDSALFGPGDKMKDRAYRLALEVVA